MLIALTVSLKDEQRDRQIGRVVDIQKTVKYIQKDEHIDFQKVDKQTGIQPDGNTDKRTNRWRNTKERR